MEPEARQSSPVRGTRALLIDEASPPGDGPSRENRAQHEVLVEALDRRGVESTRCADRFEALARAVMHESAWRSGAADPQPAKPMVIILSAAQSDRFGPAVHEAVLRAAPHSALWVHRPGAAPPLSAYRGPEAPSAQPQPVVVSEAARQMKVNPRAPSPSSEPAAPGAARHDHQSPGRPALRLSGDGPALPPLPEEAPAEPPGAGSHQGRAAPATGPLLTDEELAMLLSDDWDPGSGPR